MIFENSISIIRISFIILLFWGISNATYAQTARDRYVLECHHLDFRKNVIELSLDDSDPAISRKKIKVSENMFFSARLCENGRCWGSVTRYSRSDGYEELDFGWVSTDELCYTIHQYRNDLIFHSPDSKAPFIRTSYNRPIRADLLDMKGDWLKIHTADDLTGWVPLSRPKELRYSFESMLAEFNYCKAFSLTPWNLQGELYKWYGRPMSEYIAKKGEPNEIYSSCYYPELSFPGGVAEDVWDTCEDGFIVARYYKYGNICVVAVPTSIDYYKFPMALEVNFGDSEREFARMYTPDSSWYVIAITDDPNIPSSGVLAKRFKSNELPWEKWYEYFCGKFKTYADGVASKSAYSFSSFIDKSEAYVRKCMGEPICEYVTADGYISKVQHLQNLWLWRNQASKEDLDLPIKILSYNSGKLYIYFIPKNGKWKCIFAERIYELCIE